MIDLPAPKPFPTTSHALRVERAGQCVRRADAEPESPGRDDFHWGEVDRPPPALGFILSLSLLVWLVLALILALLIL